MSLANIRNLQKEKGFTIVELLIVIVVIAILAAIVLISYNGITQRANATTAKANAEAVLKVAEAYAADTGNGAYADRTTLDGWSGGVTQKPAGVTLIGTTLSATHADGKTIQYIPDGTTGACIGYWDGTTAQYFFAGSATTADNAAATCS